MNPLRDREGIVTLAEPNTKYPTPFFSPASKGEKESEELLALVLLLAAELLELREH